MCRGLESITFHLATFVGFHTTYGLLVKLISLKVYRNMMKINHLKTSVPTT